MTTNALSLQFHQKEQFDSTVSRAALGGATLACLAGIVTGWPAFSQGLVALSIAGAALGASTASRIRPKSRGALALALPLLPLFSGASTPWMWALMGTAAGLSACTASWLSDPQSSLGSLRPSKLHYGATALTSGAFAFFGSATAASLYAWLVASGAPPLIALALCGATVGLFVGLGSLALHVQLDRDPSEAHLERLVEALPGDFRAPVRKALASYRGIGTTLSTLPRDAAREQLAKTVARQLVEMEALASDWTGDGDRLEEATGASLRHDIAELTSKAHGSRDSVVRAQLLAAAESLEEELLRLDEVKARRERILAKLTVQSTLLERTRVSLMGLRSGHAQVKAAGLFALNRRLEAMVDSQASDADTAAAVALEADLEAIDDRAAGRESLSPALRVVGVRP